MIEKEPKIELVTKFPEYDRALMDFIQETFGKLFQANDPILDMLELKQVENCGAVVSNTKGEQFESNPMELKLSIQIKEEDVLNANYDSLIVELYREAMKNLDIFMPRVVELFPKMAVVSGKVCLENFSWDEFLDEFENLVWSLNPNSDPELRLVVSPELKRFFDEHPPNAEQQARQEAIIKKKLEESRVNRRNRKLS